MVSGDPCAELESIKSVSDVIAPLDGTVVEVNEDIVATPERVNEDPYAAWLVKVRLHDPSSFRQLLDADAYRALLGA